MTGVCGITYTNSEIQVQPVAPGTTDDQIQAHGLQPGTYVLLCFIPDDELGVPHAFLGMHKVVELH